MLDIAVEAAVRMAVAVAVAVDEGVCVERNEDRDEAEAEGERLVSAIVILRRIRFWIGVRVSECPGWVVE